VTLEEARDVLRDRLVTLDWPPQTALRTLLTGAEMLRQFPSDYLPFRVINNYGPTECTVVATSGPVPHDVCTNSRPTIGRPIANTQVYILDEDMQPVPDHAAGEIYVGGAGVARGYLNRPELTQERFVKDPFSKDPCARLYRTGDLARWRLDGNIEFLGRIDHQVKVRGFRIELGEIEAVLAEHSVVRQAVVLAREDTPGDKRLVAYIVPADVAGATAETLRVVLRERLPDYMLPSAYVMLEHLPLTPNGKIDRRALLALAPVVTREPRLYCAPRDHLEQTLCRLWEEVLGIARIGIDDDFFELGGHSLLAASLFSRLDQALGRALPLATLFEAPYVAGAIHVALSVQKRNQGQKKNKGKTVLIFDEQEAFEGRVEDLIGEPPDFTNTFYGRGYRHKWANNRGVLVACA